MSRYALPFGLLLAIVAVAGGIRMFSTPASPRLGTWQPDPALYAADAAILGRASGRAPMIWEPAQAPDIVVIVMDTTRKDRLGVYGYDKQTSPRLDRWADNARVYDEFRADGPWTLPSHASLFTGKWPADHGARGVPLSVPEQAAPLRKGTPTVARALRSAGYRTIGIAANKAFLDPAWGLSQGFDVWLCGDLPDAPEGGVDPTADRITALAQAALKAPRAGGTFLFLNYMDPHTPWHLRDGYVREPALIRRKTLPGGPAWQRATDRLMAQQAPSVENRKSWSEAYDGEIRFMDEHLGVLLDALPSLGIGDDDFVFVLADHGEYLGEHSLIEHSKDVYEPVIAVPLLIRGPGYVRGRDPTPLQHHDVASMILAAAGLPPLDGAVSTEGLQVTESYFARKRELSNPALAKRFDRVRRAFVQPPYKLILGDDGSSEAFDLSADPSETSPVGAAPWRLPLQAAAQRWIAGRTMVTPSAMEDPVNTDALRALGYIQ